MLKNVTIPNCYIYLFTFFLVLLLTSCGGRQAPQSGRAYDWNQCIEQYLADNTSGYNPKDEKGYNTSCYSMLKSQGRSSKQSADLCLGVSNYYCMKDKGYSDQFLFEMRICRDAKRAGLIK